jgi:thiamine-phosphate pyrophosphorylase
MGAPAITGYYAIIDVRPLPGGGLADGQLEREQTRAEALLAARPCVLQLRGKGVADRGLVALGRALGLLCRRAGVPFCMNDRPDLAFLAEADLVHVGQDDLPLGEVRRVQAKLGRTTPIGVSTHNLAQARAAVEAGADYIGFGPVFATASKEKPDPEVGLAGLAAVVAAVNVPVVAIGGISQQTIAAVAATGAAAAAVIGDINKASDPTAAGRAIAAAFLSAIPRGR